MPYHFLPLTDNPFQALFHDSRSNPNSRPPTTQPHYLFDSGRELYLQALEQEREEIKFLETVDIPDFGSYTPLGRSQSAMYAQNDRQTDFRETVSQRQEKLEFIRRQEFTRRLVQKGLRDPAVSQYEIKRLSPLKPRTIGRVQATIKIQRFYRAHRTLSTLTHFEMRINAAEDFSHNINAKLSYLRARATELAALGAFLDDVPHMADDSRVWEKAQHVTDTLREALMRTERETKKGDVWVHETRLVGHVGQRAVTASCGFDSSESKSKLEVVHYEEREKPAKAVDITHSNNDDSRRWRGVYLPESDPFDDINEELEFGFCEPEEDRYSDSSRAALVALCSGSIQQKRWIAQILTARPRKPPRRHSGVSKVPTLLTISEDKESSSETESSSSESLS